jgi:predicted transposase YdaD
LGSVVPYQMELRGGWVHRLYLEDLLPLTNLEPTLALLRLMVVSIEDIGTDAQAILRGVNSETEFLRVLDLVEAILVNKLPSLTLEEIREMLDLPNVSLNETQFFKEVSQKGKTDLILRQTRRRCGEISIEQEAQIRSLPIERLENLGVALLDFGGMADLEDWLRENVEG